MRNSQRNRQTNENMDTGAIEQPPPTAEPQPTPQQNATPQEPRIILEEIKNLIQMEIQQALGNGRGPLSGTPVSPNNGGNNKKNKKGGKNNKGGNKNQTNNNPPQQQQPNNNQNGIRTPPQNRNRTPSRNRNNGPPHQNRTPSQQPQRGRSTAPKQYSGANRSTSNGSRRQPSVHFERQPQQRNNSRPSSGYGPQHPSGNQKFNRNMCTTSQTNNYQEHWRNSSQRGRNSSYVRAPSQQQRFNQRPGWQIGEPQSRNTSHYQNNYTTPYWQNQHRNGSRPPTYRRN